LITIRNQPNAGSQVVLVPADYLGCIVPAVQGGFGLAFASDEVFLPISMDRNYPRLNSGNQQVP
jgi:hypothetical protein